MSLQAKAQKIASFLPANKQIFLSSAQFENPQQIPNGLKSKFFDENIKEIAKKFAEAVFAQKEASQIEQTDVIIQLEEWLSADGVKFVIQKKPQPKNQNTQKKPELPQHKLAQDQGMRRVHNQQGNLSPKPQRQEQPQNYPSHNNAGGQNHYNQQRPQTYYQNPPPQGRQTAIKYAQRQVQTNQPVQNQQAYLEQQIKRQQYEKQNYGWIDHLSKCLTYPERRFYIMSEMHPKRKF